MARTAMHWINGDWVATGELRDSINPATYEAIGRYYNGGKPEAFQEISRVTSAMRYWSAMARTQSSLQGNIPEYCKRAGAQRVQP